VKDFKVANLIGAHCTGIEAVYRIRESLALHRSSAVVAPWDQPSFSAKAFTAARWPGKLSPY
jgi:hypothetical protein